jgi:hypothetical protein
MDFAKTFFLFSTGTVLAHCWNYGSGWQRLFASC